MDRRYPADSLGLVALDPGAWRSIYVAVQTASNARLGVRAQLPVWDGPSGDNRDECSGERYLLVGEQIHGVCRDGRVRITLTSDTHRVTQGNLH